MKVAVIADTHLPRGSRHLPAECVVRLRVVDLILHAGDPGCAAVAYGHTHTPQMQLHEGVWILNPGSPTERRRSPDRTMLELTIRGGVIEPDLIDLA